jgi:hypothetical protein
LLISAGVNVQEFYRMKILPGVNLEEYIFRGFGDQSRKFGGQLPLEEEMPRVRQLIQGHLIVSRLHAFSSLLLHPQSPAKDGLCLIWMRCGKPFWQTETM